MNHYLVTFRNLKIADVKLVAKDRPEAKAAAKQIAKYLHPNTRITVKDVWLCTKVYS